MFNRVMYRGGSCKASLKRLRLVLGNQGCATIGLAFDSTTLGSNTRRRVQNSVANFEVQNCLEHQDQRSYLMYPHQYRPESIRE
jgi:hypothetical protein